MKIALLFAVAPLLVAAQDIPIKDLTSLLPKPAELVEINLDSTMLQLASGFLDDKDPEKAKVRETLKGLKGIYVRSFKYDKTGAYTPETVQKLRSYVTGNSWQQIVNVTSSKPGGENAGVYFKTDGKQIQGMVVIAAEPKELTVVNIVGNIDPKALNSIGGNFGIPNMSFGNDGKKSGNKKDDDE